MITPEFRIERRSEPRVSVDIRARLKSLDPVTSVGPSTIARIIEISHHGLKVRVGRKFMRGASVHIMAESKIFFGYVRYCLAIDEDFLVGIQLDGVISGARPNGFVLQIDRPVVRDIAMLLR